MVDDEIPRCLQIEIIDEGKLLVSNFCLGVWVEIEPVEIVPERPEELAENVLEQVLPI